MSVFFDHSGTLSGHSSGHFSLPIWRYLVSYVTYRDVLDASGPVVFVKAQLILQKNTVFSGFYWGRLVLLGSSEALVLSHHPTPLVQSSQSQIYHLKVHLSGLRLREFVV
jgi:hypothetical protein